MDSTSPHIPLTPAEAGVQQIQPAAPGWAGTRHRREFTAARRVVTIRPSDKVEAIRVASSIFRRQLTVEWGQCDPAGIVFNSRFFEMFDVSTWRMFQTALGVNPHELAGAFGIWGIPLVDVRANFLKPVKFGDVIEIASWVGEFRRSSFDIEHRLSVGGELAVEAGETRVWATRRKDDPEKLGGTAIPADVIAKFGSAE